MKGGGEEEEDEEEEEQEEEEEECNLLTLFYNFSEKLLPQGSFQTDEPVCFHVLDSWT